MSEGKALPEVSIKDLLIWDGERSQCCGYLNKKASKSSAFSKGKWQRRWFLIDINLEGNENYCLEYYHSPEDKSARQSFSLVNASIKIAGGNSFLVYLNDGSVLTLSTTSPEIMQNWIETIESVVSVANWRQRLIQEYSTRYSDAGNESASMDTRDRGKKVQTNTLRNALGATQYDDLPGSPKTIVSVAAHKDYPALRLDVDANTIPPGSTDRHQALEMFSDDLAKSLEITPDMIEIVSVKPAPGMDWLTMIEFDINTDSLYEDETEDPDPEYLHAIAEEREAIREKLLTTLHGLVQDQYSVLYQGFLTSKLDPSFARNLLPKGMEEEEITAFSSDAEVLEILERYKDIQVPPTFLDTTHFNITLCFENKFYSLRVPNPMVLRKRCCAVWAFEVKQALGFLGTMQELWIEPMALVPMDVPKLISDPIPFENSVRMGNTRLINATRLKADFTYAVECEDRREEALNSLSREEMDQIKQTFQKCDKNSDGGISKTEMMEIVKGRGQERRAAIEEKFQEFVSEPGVSNEEVMLAERNKAQYFQQIREAQNKLIKMFDAADLNGDGLISFTEFIMAEAWWQRCTINPDRAHLF